MCEYMYEYEMSPSPENYNILEQGSKIAHTCLSIIILEGWIVPITQCKMGVTHSWLICAMCQRFTARYNTKLTYPRSTSEVGKM